jgi:hypothetical protein
VWSDSAQEVTSPVIQVQLKRTEEDRVDKTINSKNLTEPLRIVIPQEPVINSSKIRLSSQNAFIAFNKTSLRSKVMINVVGVKLKGDSSSDVMLNITIYAVNVSRKDIKDMDEFINSTNLTTAIFNDLFVHG